MQHKNTILNKTIAYLLKLILIPAILFSVGCSEQGRFTLLNGESHSLDDYSGQWVVINFWAEWCAPCREEIPALNQLAREGGVQGVSVIGVSFDPLEGPRLRDLVSKWQFEYQVMATEPVPILPFQLPAQLPTNYILNPRGELVKTLVGKQDIESLRAAIQQARLLDEN